MSQEEAPEQDAPAGSLWVCCACGKTAENRYGMGGRHSPGWDESCMLNSQLFETSRLVWGGRPERIVAGADGPCFVGRDAYVVRVEPRPANPGAATTGEPR